MAEFTGAALPLSRQGFDRALDLLGIGPAEVWTVLAVETRGCGFLPDRRPLILFERHIFHSQTGGIHGANPGISSPEPGGYLGGALEYDRLRAALALDRHAALNSTSWGIGQVMGFNARAAGFASVEAMVDSALESEDAQLTAMVNFMKSEGLQAPLARHDWSGFARRYNGPAFQKNQYDTRLAAAFQKFSEGPLPDLSVRQVQVLLSFLGVDPGGIDGVAGRRTRAAVAQFRRERGLGGGEEIDAPVISALVAKVGELARAAGA